MKSILLFKMFLGLVETMFGLCICFGYSTFSLPEWQALKILLSLHPVDSLSKSWVITLEDPLYPCTHLAGMSLGAVACNTCYGTAQLMLRLMVVAYNYLISIFMDQDKSKFINKQYLKNLNMIVALCLLCP